MQIRRLEQLLVLFLSGSSQYPDWRAVGVPEGIPFQLSRSERERHWVLHFDPTLSPHTVSGVNIREPFLEGVPVCLVNDPVPFLKVLDDRRLDLCFRSLVYVQLGFEGFHGSP